MAMAAVAYRVLVTKAAAVQAVVAKWVVTVRRDCPLMASVKSRKNKNIPR